MALRRGGVVARSYASHREGTDAVGTAHIKLLAVRGGRAIAVGIDDASRRVPNHLIVAVDAPCLADAALQFQELGVGILEHLLVLLRPFMASCHIAQRQHIACLGDGGLPHQRIAVFLGTTVFQHIAHLGNEHILHGGLQIGIFGQHRVKTCRGVIQFLILQCQRTELVQPSVVSLPTVSPLPRHGVHLEEARAFEGVGGCLDYRGWCVEETPALEKRHDKTRNLNRGIYTILIGVEIGGRTAYRSAFLPFIRAMQIDVEFLAATKGIALGETHDEFGS